MTLLLPLVGSAATAMRFRGLVDVEPVGDQRRDVEAVAHRRERRR